MGWQPQIYLGLLEDSVPNQFGLATIGTMIGVVVMLYLDVTLG
jgi:hypothetical protein